MDLNGYRDALRKQKASLPLREGVDLNTLLLTYPRNIFGLPLREGVDLNTYVNIKNNLFAVSLCVREWI